MQDASSSIVLFIIQIDSGLHRHAARGWHSLYQLCPKELETTHHLLATCRFSKGICSGRFACKFILEPSHTYHNSALFGHGKRGAKEGHVFSHSSNGLLRKIPSPI
ncbi:hypothetical protein SORBI_3003G281450 [Sorghum bicolor]|uniref:Uncharacterized protein n=1 Tax=Sorghum bicolor TaxID=4558 RepID=A0A1W0VZA1_SORBI|nr:hypothetical protein SORBI_3003G281450 [Sorghum bicolor]